VAEAAAIAMDLIRKRGTLRTPAIAEQLGIGEAAVDALLEPFSRSGGELITCAVQVGDRRVIEYRCSTLGGYTNGDWRTKSEHRKPPTPIKEPTAPQRESGSRSADAGDGAGGTSAGLHTRPLSATSAADAVATKEEHGMKTFLERVTAVLQKHGPMTSKELREHGMEDANASTLVGQLANRGALAKVGGGKRSTIYGLPGQKANDAKAEKSSPIARRRRKAKNAAKRARGAVAVRRKRTVQRPRKTFRAALASDGSILLLGAKRGDLEIDRDAARAVVKLVRGVTSAELAAVVDFIERLDKAEVAA